MEDFLIEINYMIFIQYVYQSFENISYYEDDFGIHMYDKVNHCSLYFTDERIIEFKVEEESNMYYLHFEFVSMKNALSLLKDFKKHLCQLKEMKVLICCSNAMTSSYLCHLLNDYVKKSNEKMCFDFGSYTKIDELQSYYDCILLAPQIAHKRLLYMYTHLYVIETNDYATYNCHKIINFVKRMLS